MTPSPAATNPSVAVVGAGIAGLACAGALQEAGWQVRVFDKSRGPGGRSATRRSEAGSYDHGAQYFTVRDPAFGRAVAAWQADGTVAPWVARVVRIEGARARPVPLAPDGGDRMVGMPGMSALGRALARGLEVEVECPIVRARREAAGWRLEAGTASPAQTRDLPERWDWLVSAAPAPQTAALLADVPALAAAAAARTMVPCWAVMVDFDPCPDPGWDAAFIDGHSLAWASREPSRPGRAPGERWVLHASVAWSLDHLEAPADEVATRLLATFREVSGMASPARALRAHRWRYARPDEALPPLPGDSLLDRQVRAGACGDWACAGRIEDAWRSGRALATRLLDRAG